MSSTSAPVRSSSSRIDMSWTVVEREGPVEQVGPEVTVTAPR